MDNNKFKEYQKEIARLRQVDTNTTNRVRATYSIKQEQEEQEQQADLELITKRREKEVEDFGKSLQVLQKLALDKNFKGWINKVAK